MNGKKVLDIAIIQFLKIYELHIYIFCISYSIFFFFIFIISLLYQNN